MGSNQAASPTGSLGELLGSNRNRNSGGNSNSDETDSVETQLAMRIIELDETWSRKGTQPAALTHPLLALTHTGAGKFRPLFTEVKIESEMIALDSVFDRLAKRSHQAKQTEILLEQLKGQ